LKLGKNKRDRAESITGKADFKSIENAFVKKEYEFYKKGGGPLGKKNQSRILKIHETGQISYWKDKEVKGVILISKNTKVGKSDKNSYGWFIEIDEDGKSRKFEFEDKKKEDAHPNEWVNII